MPPPSQQRTLKEQALDLLRSDTRTIAQLHTATGLGYHWLRKMRKGLIKNPGCDRISQLHQKLTSA